MLLDRSVHPSIRRIGPGKVGRAGPALVTKDLAGKRPRAGVPRHDMEMHVRVHHHQHEVIDLVIGKSPMERLLDLIGDMMKLRERLLTDVRQRGCLLQGYDHERPKRDLLGTEQDNPVPELFEHGIRGSKFFHRGVHVSHFFGCPLTDSVVRHDPEPFAWSSP